MLGSASDKALDEMIAYAHETQHEKIIRGLAVGMSLIMYPFPRPHCLWRLGARS